jgi:hypothetical protein
MITKNQTKRLEDDMKRIAKSNDIRIKMIENEVYAFGGELEVLRIFAYYLSKGNHPSTRYTVDYSKNYKSYFLRFELDI